MKIQTVYIFDLVFSLLLSLLSLSPSYIMKERGIKNKPVVFFLSSICISIICFFLKYETDKYISTYIIGITLLICAYIDKETKEIPEYFHVIILISSISLVDFSRIYENIFYSLITFIFLYLIQKKTGLGGADVKMMTCLAFSFKLYILPFLLFAFLIFIFSILPKRKKTILQTSQAMSYPLFPCLYISFILTNIIKIFF